MKSHSLHVARPLGLLQGQGQGQSIILVTSLTCNDTWDPGPEDTGQLHQPRRPDRPPGGNSVVCVGVRLRHGVHGTTADHAPPGATPPSRSPDGLLLSGELPFPSRPSRLPRAARPAGGHRPGDLGHTDLHRVTLAPEVTCPCGGGPLHSRSCWKAASCLWRGLCSPLPEPSTRDVPTAVWGVKEPTNDHVLAPRGSAPRPAAHPAHAATKSPPDGTPRRLVSPPHVPAEGRGSARAPRNPSQAAARWPRWPQA